jgi:hypothetical protein
LGEGFQSEEEIKILEKSDIVALLDPVDQLREVYLIVTVHLDAGVFVVKPPHSSIGENRPLGRSSSEINVYLKARIGHLSMRFPWRLLSKSTFQALASPTAMAFL